VIWIRLTPMPSSLDDCMVKRPCRWILTVERPSSSSACYTAIGPARNLQLLQLRSVFARILDLKHEVVHLGVSVPRLQYSTNLQRQLTD
jgi:hypothetical protein